MNEMTEDRASISSTELLVSSIGVENTSVQEQPLCFCHGHKCDLDNKNHHQSTQEHAGGVQRAA